MIGSCSPAGAFTLVFDPIVSVTAESRISPPPAHALGPSCSPSTKMPSSDPISGSMFNRIPACEAGTWVSPQFHKSVVVAVPGAIAVDGLLWNGAPFDPYGIVSKPGKYFDLENGVLTLN